jgi:outer membrane protein assembly factor BamB
VTDSIVAVAVSGRIIAYDILSGNKKWMGSDGGESYSSPQLLTLGGVKQVLFMNKTNVTGFAPGDGSELWKVPMKGSPIIQPSPVNENEFLISEVNDMGGQGIQLISVKNGSGSWTTKELWRSNRFRPYFNDIVVHKGYVYGFEGPALTCVDLEKGNRIWRGGRYGGQIILLADQDIILVLTEKGELALVSATPDKFTELARIPAIKGKTWNHPVLAGNILLVRNSQEMAAFKLVSL